MIIEFLGRHGEVLKSVDMPPLCERISIREGTAADRQVHFPNRAPDWGRKQKISDFTEAATTAP